MRIPWRIAEVLDDLNFTPIVRKTGIHFGPDVSFANWADVAALGARLVELGQKLQEQAKEAAAGPVCVGTGTEVCFRPRLVLVWVDPLKFAGGVSDIIGFLNCGDQEAIGIWHWAPSKKLVLVGIVGGSAYGSAPIQAIKELRAVTGYGLKEAKDIIDALRNGETWIFPGDTPPDVSGCQYLRFEWR